MVGSSLLIPMHLNSNPSKGLKALDTRFRRTAVASMAVDALTLSFRFAFLLFPFLVNPQRAQFRSLGPLQLHGANPVLQRSPSVSVLSPPT
jgi:hypothetical protein